MLEVKQIGKLFRVKLKGTSFPKTYVCKIHTNNNALEPVVFIWLNDQEDIERVAVPFIDPKENLSDRFSETWEYVNLTEDNLATDIQYQLNYIIEGEGRLDEGTNTEGSCCFWYYLYFIQ